MEKGGEYRVANVKVDIVDLITRICDEAGIEVVDEKIAGEICVGARKRVGERYFSFIEVINKHPYNEKKRIKIEPKRNLFGLLNLKGGLAWLKMTL